MCWYVKRSFVNHKLSPLPLLLLQKSSSSSSSSVLPSVARFIMGPMEKTSRFLSDPGSKNDPIGPQRMPAPPQLLQALSSARLPSAHKPGMDGEPHVQLGHDETRFIDGSSGHPLWLLDIGNVSTCLKQLAQTYVAEQPRELFWDWPPHVLWTGE